MALFTTWLELALRVAAILLFPALAVRAWRAGGAGRLWRAAGIALAVLVAAAVFVATPAAGNALARTHGYGYAVPTSLLLHGCMLGLPIAATSVTVWALGRRLSSAPALYGLGVLAAGLGWVVGIVMAVSIFYAVR